MKNVKPAIIVYYPCCAGGKFVINSLSLSRYFVLHDTDLAQWDVKQKVHDQQYYSRKLEIILKTVPDHPNDSQWLKYELGVNSEWDSPDSDFLQPLLEQNTHSFPLTANTIDRVLTLKEIFTNNFVVKLTNYTKWLTVSQFKMPEVQQDLKNKIEYWNFVDQQELAGEKFFDYLVDVDGSYFDQDKIKQSIQGLYQQLGFDDFQSDLWTQYYQKYINAHRLS